MGDLDEAFRWFDQAKRIDPYFEPAWRWHILGVAHFSAGRYDEAISAMNRSTTMPGWIQAYIAACYALMGKGERANEYRDVVPRLMPGFSASLFAAKEPFKRPADREHLLDGLRRAGFAM
jgi:tetratricopeptide (TPR) repeat protein